MAHFVLKDAMVLLGAVDLSDHVRSVTINYSAELIEDTAMSDVSRSRVAGLKDWSATVEFAQDEAGSEVADTIFALVGVAGTFECRPTSAARSATNPGYNGTGIIESYNPVSGSVGTLATTSITIQGSNGVALLRSTSA